MEIDQIQKKLEELKDLATNACDAAYKAFEAGEFANTAVNWLDLGCVAAEYVFSWDGQCLAEDFRVIIEEAESPELENYIRAELEKCGYESVCVQTQW